MRTTARPPLRRGRSCAAQLGVEHRHAAAVAELVGDERDHRHRVDRGVEPGGARVERRGHQAARVEQAHDVAVLFDAVHVAHRAADPLARGPVDLAHVVVGEVVADRLEVGAETERAAGAQARVAELAAAQRDDDALRGDDVGIDEQRRLALAGERAAPEPERTAAARGDGRQHRRAAPVRDHAARRARRAPTDGSIVDVGRLRLADLDAAAALPASVSTSSARRDAARERARNRPAHAEPVVRDHDVDDRRDHDERDAA